MVLSEILEGMIAWTLALVQAYGPYSVFIVVILEEVLVPIPSVLVLMGAGFILIEPGIALWDALSQIFFIIVLPASVASTIGSFFMYGIGYYGGKPLITKFRKFLGVSWGEIKDTEKKLEEGRKVWVTIAAMRAIPFFPIALVSLSSGVLRLSWKKYAVATFIGSLPRTFILAFIGWRLGEAYVSLADRLGFVEDLIIIAVVAGVLYLIYKHRHKLSRLKNKRVSEIR